MKPTEDSVCDKIIQPKKYDSKCLIGLATTTPKPNNSTDDFAWTNVEDMLEQNANVSTILTKIGDKFDSLMENGSILNLMNTTQRLTERATASGFEDDHKEITSKFLRIFSSTLDDKYRSAWTKIDYSERKNASMQIIVQMNNLIENNYCIMDDDVFDINPNNQSKYRNRIRSHNILLEAYKLRAVNLTSDFGFPENLSSNLQDAFGRNVIYFPDGLNLDEIDIGNPEMRCEKTMSKNGHFATGVVYKNLAEYLHYNRSSDKAADVIASSIDEDFDFDDGDDLNSTNYTIRNNIKFDKANEYDDHLLNSELVAFTFNNIMEKSVKLNRPVRVIMEHLNTKERLDKLRCVFWNFTTKEWSEDGCRLVDNNRLYSVCECDHLTNFAILMDVSGRELDSPVKSAISMLCVILSIIGLLITIVCFTFIPKLKSKRNLITANLCFNLLIVNVLVGFFLEIKNEVSNHLVVNC